MKFTVRELRESQGRGEVFNPRRLTDSVEVIGAAIGLDAIAEAIDVTLIERLGSSWDEMFGRLITYKQKHGHCLVPQEYSDKQLGTWVDTQRRFKNQGSLQPARIERLEEVGFVWDPHGEYWEDMFRRLVAYKQQYGDCLVPQDYGDKPQGYSNKRLGAWVNTQRTLKNRNKLEAIRVQRLDELGFVWEPISEYWEDMFRRLVTYKQVHGDCLVPKSYSDKQFAIWVHSQRTIKTKGKLDPVRIQRLDELKFVWDAINEYWEDMFRRLVAYKQQYGDCLVPQTYSDIQLATWVGTQRTLEKRGSLSPARIERLEGLEFSWDPIGESWEEMFARLVAYKQKHGDYLVPQSYDDMKLAKWVSKQRVLKNSGKLEPKRIQRLEELGFSWNPIDESWEDMFRRLAAYKQEHGNCSVPQGYSDKKLVNWLRNQRSFKNSGKLEPKRIQRLEELGFSWNPIDESWEDMFRGLAAYKQEHGDCMVPGSYGDRQLATWVRTQRTLNNKHKLHPSRIERLEELGFSWDPYGESWESMFRRLVTYNQQYGDCLVPRGYRDKPLATWVDTQRAFKDKGNLDPARIQRLEFLGFVWNARDESWEQMFRRLVSYKQQHGDCLVPKTYMDKQLGTWINTLRTFKTKRALDPVRIQRLDELGFVWEAQSAAWEEMFGRLVAYKQKHGDCLVPGSYSDKELAPWVKRQRTLRNRGKLEAAREHRLNELEFVWDQFDESWEEMFGRLVAYKQEHGDCLVSQKSGSDKKLGIWVFTQRRLKNKGKFESARIERLEKLGFVWDPHGESWNEMFSRLVVYKQVYGDCLVPSSYRDKILVQWVFDHRAYKKRGNLETARVQRLEDLGFVWDAREQQWDQMFRSLVAYKQKHGDCRVPRSYSGKTLANWVAKQRVRKNRGKLEPARIQRLEELGFVWEGRE